MDYNFTMKSATGFTLLNSINVIIVGLLIGGIFGLTRLVDNAQVEKTVDDLNATESAALTFRDTFGGLPGDIRNRSTRLPNRTATLCTTYCSRRWEHATRRRDSSLIAHSASYGRRREATNTSIGRQISI
jgi:hypothetical protein